MGSRDQRDSHLDHPMGVPTSTGGRVARTSARTHRKSARKSTAYVWRKTTSPQSMTRPQPPNYGTNSDVSHIKYLADVPLRVVVPPSFSSPFRVHEMETPRSPVVGVVGTGGLRGSVRRVCSVLLGVGRPSTQNHLKEIHFW